MIAEVFVDLPSAVPDRSYDYEIPVRLADVIEVGSLVVVPFSGQEKLGIVAKKKSSSKVKRLLSIKDEAGADLVSGEMMSLCRWVADRYFTSFYRVLKLALPPGGMPRIERRWIIEDVEELEKYFRDRGSGVRGQVRIIKGLMINESQARSLKIFDSLDKLSRRGIVVKHFEIAPPKVRARIVRHYTLLIDEEEALRLIRKGAKKQEMVVQTLAAAGRPLPAPQLHSFSSHQTIKSLVKKGVISEMGFESNRIPREHSLPLPADPVLNKTQEEALQIIADKLRENRCLEVLIQGVTASGKTKIYTEAVALAADSGKGSIVIVPEISLTPQMLSSFKAKFGNDVALIHSGLGLGERFDEWKNIHNGCKIAVGTRSAIFSPVRNLGLIIIDEEHDSSYKQDTDPRYHLHKVAQKRAELNKATLILGSATPQIETRYEANLKENVLIELPERAGKHPLPSTRIIDMRGKPKEETLFSNDLLEATRTSISSGEKILLYFNRRGFARFSLCKSCGWVARCKDCDISLIYHKYERALKCHQCGYSEEETAFCPKCGEEPGIFGLGIQRVEEELKGLFPDIPVVRIDTDSTRKKGAHIDLFSSFRKHEVAILLGTQMITKGHHFPEIGLVGVINADLLLNFPDFRAGERTFQQLVQVSGRAGRGNIPGKVIIQTFNPDSDPVASALKSYDDFFQKEVANRKCLNYPPFSELINLTVFGSSAKKVEEKAKLLFDLFERNLHNYATVIGPAPAPYSKLRGAYRWHILLKTRDFGRTHDWISDNLADIKRSLIGSSIKLAVDVDPVSMM